jgi:hypothetical protein
MTTFIIVIAIAAVALFLAMKTGKVKDENNNNIPDAIEEKVEEVKEVVKKVKAVAEKATKVAKSVVVEKKATKKAAPKKTK